MMSKGISWDHCQDARMQKDGFPEKTLIWYELLEAL